MASCRIAIVSSRRPEMRRAPPEFTGIVEPAPALAIVSDPLDVPVDRSRWLGSERSSQLLTALPAC